MTTPNELYAECLSRPGDWAWESEHAAGWRPSDCDGEPIATAPAPAFRPNPNAKPCPTCGSDFYWQDMAGGLWCVVCAEPASVALVQAIWQVVEADGVRGAVDATGVCLEILRRHRSRQVKNRRG